MSNITYTDFVSIADLTGRLSVPSPNVWIRFHSNSTGTDYFSSAKTDPATGQYSVVCPQDDYSVYYGAAATVPGTPTLANPHLRVTYSSGDDAVFRDVTTAVNSPYVPSASILPGEEVTAVNPYNVKFYGAKGDGRSMFDGSMSNGSPTLTSATAAFTAADAGKLCFVQDGVSAAVSLNTTISAFISSTQVTLAANCTNGAGITNAEVFVATDDRAAIQLAITTAPVGTRVKASAAQYGLSGGLTGKSGVGVIGDGACISQGLYNLMQGAGYGLNLPPINVAATGTRFVCALANATIFSESQIRDARLEGIDLDGFYNAGIGLDTSSAIGCKHVDVLTERITGTPGVGVRLTVGSDAANRNCMFNRYEDVNAWWVNYGFRFSGGATGLARVTLNKFMRTYVFTIAATGAGYHGVQYADTNWFHEAGVTMLTDSATAYGALMNDSATPAAEVGLDGNMFFGFTANAPSFTANNILVKLNVSQHNQFFMDFCIVKAGNALSVPTPATTSYAWWYLNQETNIVTALEGPLEIIGVTGQTTPGWQIRSQGTLDVKYTKENATQYVQRAIVPNKKIYAADAATGALVLGDAGVSLQTQTGLALADVNEAVQANTKAYANNGLPNSGFGNTNDVYLHGGTAAVYGKKGGSAWALGAPNIQQSPAPLTAQTAAVASVATLTSPNDGAKHTYMVSGFVTITTLGSGSFNLQVSYTDSNGTARTCNIPLAAQAGTFGALANTADDYKGTVEITVNPNTAVTIKTAGTFTGCTYNVGGNIKQVL